MIQFSVLDGKRRTIRLGKMNRRRAERIKDFVEDLVEAHRSGQRPMPPTVEWVVGLPPVMRQRLERAGLVTSGRGAGCPTLGEWLSAYIGGRTDAKPSTRTVWGHTRRNLLDFFGKDKPIDGITPGDADQWRLFLVGQNLAENTVRRRGGIAKQFFNFASGTRQNPRFLRRFVIVRLIAISPMEVWWALEDSNLRPPPCKGGALAN